MLLQMVQQLAIDWKQFTWFWFIFSTEELDNSIDQSKPEKYFLTCGLKYNFDTS